MLVETHRKPNAPPGACLGLEHSDARDAEIILILANGTDLRFCRDCAESSSKILRADAERIKRQDAKNSKQVQQKNASGNENGC